MKHTHNLIVTNLWHRYSAKHESARQCLR